MGGYIQNGYETDAENYLAMATSYSEQEQEMADLYQETIEEERQFHQDFERTMSQIFDKVFLWSAINESDAINPSDKATQQLLAQNSICAMLNTLERNNEDSCAKRLYTHFEIFNLTEPFMLTDPSPDAEFYYNISRATWDAFKAEGVTTGRVNTTASFLTGQLAAANVPSPILQTILACTGNTIFEANLSTTRMILGDPLRDIRWQIFDAEEQAAEAQGRADQAAMGVSISTVSVVLSSAMKSSVDNKKSAKMIASALSSGGSVSATDRLAVPVLIIAGILSVAGLVMALF